MSYLIDTNVLSELRRKQPDANVVAWFKQRPRQSLYLSVLTLGEIRKGIERLDDVPGSLRRQTLVDWLQQDLPTFFLGRLLPVDTHVADRWGRLLASAARPLPAIGGLLAATALHHDMTLVSRNVKDFIGLNLDIINPWDVQEG